MSQFTFSAERVLDAPAAVVYHCLRDYRDHHNTSGFLPPIFTALDVLRGGVGAGTIIRFTTTVAGRSVTRTQEVSEPDPGHILVEWGDGEGSTFTVEPRGAQAFVRIETVLQSHGFEALLMRIFGGKLVNPLFADELDRLERHARAHPAMVAAA
jgi:Polyketide cyclase / dehydrase and lipid transport